METNLIEKEVLQETLEVNLVFDVRNCSKCDFFFPKDKAKPYGPYPAYDFNCNYPKLNTPDLQPGDNRKVPWTMGNTVKEAFPKPEIMDGCRKAPIMTIGINPNLTAFAENPKGARWVYPEFTSNNDTDEWAKYAYYYRYRTVMQESLGKEILENSFLEDNQIIAKKSGIITYPDRKCIDREISFTIKYDDDTTEPISLKWEDGTPRYVVLVYENEKFEANTIIATKINVKEGKSTQIYQEEIGYYEQFVPILNNFSTFLSKKLSEKVSLKMGEDVCQLDAVACASPHWKPDYLGGSESEKDIITNCVKKNGWALKQMAQTNPAVLVLVGEASFNMFRNAYGDNIIPSLDGYPDDGAFTLLKETTNDKSPYYFVYNAIFNGQKYSIKTRLVVSPHFSYDDNFYVQSRMTYEEFERFKEECPNAYSFLSTNSDVKITIPQYRNEKYAIQFASNSDEILSKLKSECPNGWNIINNNLFNPHLMIAEVLEQEYNKGTIEYTDRAVGKNNFLKRTDGNCNFCTNNKWQFPEGCRYK